MLAAGGAVLAGAVLTGAREVSGAAPEAAQSGAGAETSAAAPKTPARTLVCFYLMGGSDGNGMIAPLAPAQFAAYSGARGELGLMADALLPVRDGATGAPYGFDPRLSELRHYFETGAAAVVANVGSPVRPTTQTRYESLHFLSDGYVTPDWAAREAGSALGNELAFTFPQGVSLMPLGPAAFPGERRRNPELLARIDAVSLRTPFPDSLLGRQMKIVAGLLRLGNFTGAPGGQVVFCSHNGFGPSSVQMAAQAPMFREVSTAMAALYEATVEMGAADRVTIYTDSEFGRTLRPNASHTAAPGWGNHQFVLGGAVRGGRIYGAYPDMISGPFAADSALIPTTSEAQYQATLARWAGVSAQELRSVLPALGDKSLLDFLPA